MKIAPSILSGDHGNLAAEAQRLERWGADWIHVDIMDGAFAPNLTFGPGAVKAIRRVTSLPLDCHLMLREPEKFAERFLEAGADYVTPHAEAVTQESLSFMEQLARKYHKKLGIAFKPATPLASLDLSRWQISLVVVMSVNPGFSGQKFMPEVIPKVREASKLYGASAEIEVDGGVDPGNAKELAEKGATVLVAGNSILGQSNPEQALQEMRKSVGYSHQQLV